MGIDDHTNELLFDRMCILRASIWSSTVAIDTCWITDCYKENRQQ